MPATTRTLTLQPLTPGIASWSRPNSRILGSVLKGGREGGPQNGLLGSLRARDALALVMKWVEEMWQKDDLSEVKSVLLSRLIIGLSSLLCAEPQKNSRG